MKARQSRALINFITSLKVNLEGDIMWSVLDDEIPAISEYFTPKFKVSSLAVHVKNTIGSGDYFEPTTSIKPTAEVQLVTGSSLRYLEPKTYSLLQATFLEGFSLLYALEVDSSVAKLVDVEDRERIYHNVNYVCEMLSDKEEYANTIVVLRQMLVDILYIQSRLEGGTNAL